MLPATTLTFVDDGSESMQLQNNVAAFMLEHGYDYRDAKFVTVETKDLLDSLTGDDAAICMEFTAASAQEAFDKAIAAGTILDLGINYADKKKVVNAKLAQSAPKVVELLRKYQSPADGTARALAFKSQVKASILKTAVWFLTEYINVWSTWVTDEQVSFSIKHAVFQAAYIK